MKKNNFVIFGINTDVGKTIVSAILCQKFNVDYWKPLQTGTLQVTDSKTIKKNTDLKNTNIHSETYSFKEPLSPFHCSMKENITIDFSKFKVPKSKNGLVLETAGGLLSPINKSTFMIDFITIFKAKIVLVVKHYLGSINHTLLSLEYLKQKKIPIDILVFNGDRDLYSEKIILHTIGSQTKVAYIDSTNEVSKEWVSSQILFKRTPRINK